MNLTVFRGWRVENFLVSSPDLVPYFLRLYLPQSMTATRVQVFKYLTLWGNFLISISKYHMCWTLLLLLLLSPMWHFVESFDNSAPERRKCLYQIGMCMFKPLGHFLNCDCYRRGQNIMICGIPMQIIWNSCLFFSIISTSVLALSFCQVSWVID